MTSRIGGAQHLTDRRRDVAARGISAKGDGVRVRIRQGYDFAPLGSGLGRTIEPIVARAACARHQIEIDTCFRLQPDNEPGELQYRKLTLRPPLRPCRAHHRLLEKASLRVTDLKDYMVIGDDLKQVACAG